MNKIFTLCLLTFFATKVAAAPQAYNLNLSESRIDFTYDLQGAEFAGEIPISSADVVLDFQDLSNSDISVTFNVSGVRTGFGPLTEAIKSDSVLATDQFPTATFKRGTIVQGGT